MVMIASALLLLLQVAAPAAVSGTVHDANGGAVANAAVIVRLESGAERQALTGPDGSFSIPLTGSGSVALIVRASGFSESKQTIAAGARRTNLEIKLAPAAIFETVTVTAARAEQRTFDTAASVSVLDREQIRQSPAVVADDVLRQLPSFSLFRRTSSLSSHPTAQGVSLRGIGPSGVSRTLVLLDGVPFNDPFGGWVYWTRVPLMDASRIEIVDGSSSSLYGNYAMGGVINIVSAPASRRTVDFSTQYGNLSSPKVDFSGSDVWRKVGVVVNGGGFKTDGFPIVAASERRTADQTPPGVDNLANVAYRNFNVKLDYNATDRLRAYFRSGYFHEERDNGKASTIDHTEEANDTTWTTLTGGIQARLADESDLQAAVFGDIETFHSNFLAVPAANPPRSLGRMTTNQTVPTDGFGGMAQWSKALTHANLFTAGADWRWVKGESQEDLLDTTKGQTVVTKRVAGGNQQSAGAFVQDLITPTTRLTLTVGGRVDHWSNNDPHFVETTVATGAQTVRALAPRSDTVFSPRGTALYRLSQSASVWASYGYGFRAPTLNELYRQFAQGAVTTRANDQLGPERLHGAEAGVKIAPTSNVTVRSTWFDNRVRNPVANVTIGTNLQQRQNLGQTKIAGLQTDVEYRVGSVWRVGGGYLYERARVVEYAAPAGNADLAHNCPGGIAAGESGQPCELAQVPRHRASLLATYSQPKYFTASIGLQVVGRQFDDDQNVRFVPTPALSDGGYPVDGCADTPSPDTCASSASRPGLPKYAIVSITASRAIGHNLEVFFGIQNAANRQYFVSTQPTTIGSPRMINGGVRVHFAGR